MPVDAVVAKKVREAPYPTPRKWLPLLRLLLFYAYFVPTSLALLPYSLIRSLVPFLRLDPRWSFLQNLSIMYVRRVIRNYCRFKTQPIQPRENGWRESNTAIGTVLAIANMSGPGGRVVHPKETIQAALHEAGGKRLDRVWIDPAPLDALRGILTVQTGKPGTGFAHGKTYHGPPLLDPGFAKVRTRCFWFMHQDNSAPPKPNQRKSRERPVILYFHGGASVTFSAGDLFMGECLARNLAHQSGIDVFSVDYLLAPEAKFPGNIAQGLAGWFYLTRQLGYHPSQIIIGGDSYGAELGMSLTRYLVTDFPGYEGYDIEAHGARTGERPAALLLLSPYVDARNDTVNVPPCYERNHSKDIIALAYGQWGHTERGLFYGKEAKERTRALTKADPWFTFINMPDDEIKMFPPMWVANGGNELLIDMGHEWVERARKLGVQVEHDILDYGVHDYWTLHTFLTESLESYGRFKKWWSTIERTPSHL